MQAALPEPSAECPYPGLVAYDIRDAGSFFGREPDIEACLGHLDAGGALAIVGASGSGKSSLARAGVAAALERDGRRVRVMTPGRHPMDVLGGMGRSARATCSSSTSARRCWRRTWIPPSARRSSRRWPTPPAGVR